MNAAGIKQSTCELIVAPAPTPIPGGGISIAYKIKKTKIFNKNFFFSSSPGGQTPIGPSAPYFLKELKHQPLRLGTSTVLEVRVVGVPTPQIEWLKNRKKINNYRLFIFFFNSNYKL